MQRQGSDLTIAPLLFFAGAGRTEEKDCCRGSLQQSGIKTRQGQPVAGNVFYLLISEFQYSE